MTEDKMVEFRGKKLLMLALNKKTRQDFCQTPQKSPTIEDCDKSNDQDYVPFSPSNNSGTSCTALTDEIIGLYFLSLFALCINM